MTTTAQVLARLRILLQNPQMVSQSALEALFHEVFKVTLDLRTQVESKDPEIRAKAQAEITQFQKQVEAEVARVAKLPQGAPNPAASVTDALCELQNVKAQ